jgi:hypothetical protein
VHCDLVIVYYNEWTALYVNGVLRYQNHSVDGITALQVLAETMGGMNFRITSLKTGSAGEHAELDAEDGNVPELLADMELDGPLSEIV